LRSFESTDVVDSLEELGSALARRKSELTAHG
jgi:hypothetical protein